jgi:hypothetical protein
MARYTPETIFCPYPLRKYLHHRSIALVTIAQKCDG